MSDESTENPESEEWLNVHEGNKIQTKRIFSLVFGFGFFLSLILVHNKWMCFSHISFCCSSYHGSNDMASPAWALHYSPVVYLNSINPEIHWQKEPLTNKEYAALAWGYFGRFSHADVARDLAAEPKNQKIRFDCNEHYLWQPTVLHWMHAHIFTCKIQ